jgi:beta-lactam-binding protein with PASTA domain
MSTQAPRIFSDRYELVRQIARGGMAEVWLATDQKLGRNVAVKVLFPELSTDPNFVQRFRREAQAAANLTHPNMVGIHDWGEAEGTYFIVMEFIDGRSLASIIRNEAPLAPERAAGIASEIANALAFAHQNNVVHRDVKPANVLIDSNGLIKVADFGIARAADSVTDNLTQTGAVMGTATYFSPEQAQGHHVDGRSDVYSLGCVLYEMVTGRAPFTGDNPVAIAYKHVSEELVPASKRNSAVPVALDAIIAKALTKLPVDRYQSAEELRADLIRFRQGKPVMALETPASVAAAAAGADATRVMTTPVMAGAARAAQPMPDDDYFEEDYAPEPLYKRTGFWVGVLIILMMIFGGLVYAFTSSLRNDNTTQTEQVAIPTGLVGRPSEEVVKELQNLGFQVQVTLDAEVDGVDGSVVKVEPEQGTVKDKGSVVKLTVKGQSEDVEVPNVIGKNFTDASAQLVNAGFTVRRTDIESLDKPADEVLSQSPTPPTKAKRGSEIELTVSRGAPTVTIPDVVNKTSADAANELGQLGLKTVTKSEASETVAIGNVIRTEPAAGSSIAKNETVTIIVSSGKEQVTVPNLVGKATAEATGAAEVLGFTLATQDVLTADASKVGKVISQTPAAGSSANKGSTITVQIGKAIPATTTTTTSTTTTTTTTTP